MSCRTRRADTNLDPPLVNVKMLGGRFETFQTSMEKAKNTEWEACRWASLPIEIVEKGGFQA